MTNDNAKTTVESWDSKWKPTWIERYHGIEEYMALPMRLNMVLHRFLPRSKQTILELGCAKGKKLIYFRKRYGYDVAGLDISSAGIALAARNFNTARVSGTLVCGDMFSPPFADESFDIVYSMGLVEHFDDPSLAVDAHLRLLKRGGILILTIPNFRRSIHLAMTFKKASAYLKLMNLDMMDKEYVRELLKSRRLDVRFLNYIGGVELSLGLGWVHRWFPPLFYLLMPLNQILGYLTLLMPSCKHVSPYLVVVARK